MYRALEPCAVLDFYLTPQAHYLPRSSQAQAFTMLKFSEFFPVPQNSTRFSTAPVPRRALIQIQAICSTSLIYLCLMVVYFKI